MRRLSTEVIDTEAGNSLEDNFRLEHPIFQSEQVVQTSSCSSLLGGALLLLFLLLQYYK